MRAVMRQTYYSWNKDLERRGLRYMNASLLTPESNVQELHASTSVAAIEPRAYCAQPGVHLPGRRPQYEPADGIPADSAVIISTHRMPCIYTLHLTHNT